MWAVAVCPRWPLRGAVLASRGSGVSVARGAPTAAARAAAQQNRICNSLSLAVETVLPRTRVGGEGHELQPRPRRGPCCSPPPPCTCPRTTTTADSVRLHAALGGKRESVGRSRKLETSDDARASPLGVAWDTVRRRVVVVVVGPMVAPLAAATRPPPRGARLRAGWRAWEDTVGTMAVATLLWHMPGRAQEDAAVLDLPAGAGAGPPQLRTEGGATRA